MQLLPEMIGAYKPCDVFNADEGVIFYHMQPEQTLVFKGDSCHGSKRSNEHLTPLFCANKDSSDKLPVLVTGKLACLVSMACCKNCLKTLPCSYDFNKKGWMMSSLFTNFLQQLDNEIGAKARKILRFMNKALCHPPNMSSLRNISVAFI
ncbi:hypothetical protein HPB49_020601 [Dermacentor silvarum]|uniref:Uncharacterized protein n=1 Tax=Dermacentor silvarum TaxID=543639 RepID=A0ACB8DQR5_DERSI|nr:hypothetical protein HPB49_020601 [Dermacentor silvarum]